MTSTLAHCLIFTAGIAAITAPVPFPPVSPPVASHVVATSSTPIVVEVMPDAFAPPTPQEISDFAARVPLYSA